MLFAAWAAYWTILPIPGIRWPERRSRRRLSCSKCRLRHGTDLLRAAKARHAREEVGRPVTCASGGLKGMLMRSVLSPLPFTVVR
jgi:hypothetical protein